MFFLTKKTLCILILILFVFSGISAADTLTLKSGEEFQGKIIYLDSEIVRFETEFGSLEIPRAKIKKGVFQGSSNQSKTYLKENWESGEIDDRWHIIEMCDKTPRISTNSFSGDYALEIIDHTGYDGPNIQNKKAFNLNSINLVFYYLNAEPRNAGRSVIVLKDSSQHQKDLEKDNFFSHLLINSNLEFTLFNNSMSERKVLAELEKDKWYKIELKINNEKLEILIDDSKIYTGPVNQSKKINYLQFGAGSNWEQGPRYYIDDILLKN